MYGIVNNQIQNTLLPVWKHCIKKIITTYINGDDAQGILVNGNQDSNMSCMGL